MKIPQITIMVEPRRQLPLPEPEQVLLYRENYECDRFAEELQRFTKANITIIEDYLRMAPDTGLILLFGYNIKRSISECSSELKKLLLPRTIIINEGGDRYEVLSWLNQYHLAGIINHIVYSGMWMAQAPVQYPGLYGPVAVAKSMEATIFTEEKNYCSMVVEPLLPLPQLLIRFLEAYLEIFPV